ncbi:MAG TPA: UDP-glucuronic acid decarboxylase family protein, partial [Phycisphaerae bacterium]|nr:UDP-glucuronic acid decarboxylase family protein [Phycisphaerae bacterium]
SNLCLRLFDEGHHVICLDNCFTGSLDNFADRFREMTLSGRFEFIRHDVIEAIKLEVDQIYHLACPASPVHYQYNPVKTIKTNVIGTYNMLGLAKRVKARILQASTSEVYGDPAVHPQPEEYWGNVNPIGVRSCYDEGKRVAETLMFDYYRQHKLAIRAARIFNTYGPNMSSDDGRVMSNFICQALRDEPLTVYGDGSQTRSFCYVSDLVDGLIKLMESTETGPINLGNDREITMLELVAGIGAALGKELRVEHRPLPPDDPRQRRPDLSKARRLLKYEPRVGLEAGIEKTVRYFQGLLSPS